MNEEAGENLNRHNQADIDTPPAGETQVSQDYRRLWLLGILAVAIVAIVVGNYPDQAEQSGFEASNVRIIQVDAAGTSIVFPESAGSEINVSLSGAGAGRYHLETNQTGDSLEIRARGGFLTFLPFLFGRTKLIIALPAGFGGEIRAGTSSGRIDIAGEGRSLTGATLTTSSGRIQVQDLTFTDDLQVRASSGRIELSNVDTAGTVDVTASSGSIGLEDVSAGSYRLRTNSGQVAATGLSGTALSAVTSSGRLDLSAPTMLADWELRSSSGRISVELLRPPDDMSVNFSASSGSVRVADRYGLEDAVLRGNSLQVPGSGPELHVRASSGSFNLR